tara:strand:- start:255 stop:575 length:321 start_codon:yes stop_codon:yes gene_type:complete
MEVGLKIPKNTIVLAGGGKECPRCNHISQAREHKSISPKQLQAQYYYSRWYYCLNRNCQTTVFSFEADKVYNDGNLPNIKTEAIPTNGEKEGLVPSTYSGPPPWED